LEGQLLADTAAIAEVDNLRSRGMISARVHEMLQDDLKKSHEDLSHRLAQFDVADLAVEQEQLRRLHRHLIDVKKTRLAELFREGKLSEAIHSEINERLDQEFASTQSELTGGQRLKEDQPSSAGNV
jgi:hypothetical protein